jgi:hypothetical protein
VRVIVAQDEDGLGSADVWARGVLHFHSHESGKPYWTVTSSKWTFEHGKLPSE